MKKVFSLFVVALLSVATMAQENTCKVIGKTTTDIKDGSLIMLGSFERNGRMLDSTVVKDGKFEFTVPVNDETTLFPLTIGYVESQTKWASLQFFAEPGVTLKAVLSLDNEKNRIKGSPLNFIENIYNDRRNEMTKEIVSLREAAKDEKLSEAERAEKSRLAEEKYGEIIAFMQDFAYENLDNVVGISIIGGMAPVMNKSFINKVVEEFPKKYDNHPYVVELREAVAVENKTAEGTHFVDLTMDDPKGKQVSLSQYIKENKLTLVDFWASWCGPCRAALPGVKKIYETYKKRGLGVVGVSFDSKKESWLKAIKDLELPWPQMSDLKGWNCAASPAYNIKGIPFTLLIDQNGIIVGRNLESEEAIVNKIEEILH